MKKVLVIAMLLLATFSMYAAGTAETAQTGPKEVNYWYFHKGNEATMMENVITKYNASQNKYKVVGFSVPDNQKYLVAMASGESPDVIEISDSRIPSYVDNGLLVDLSDLGKKKGYDFSIFDDVAVRNNSFDGKMYGYPISSVVIQMYYNKDILNAIGETEPPKTMEELYDMAIRATTVDEKGNIDILGYPLFPLASARQELIYAFGNAWTEEDNMTPTANAQGILDSLNMNVKFREKYDINKVQAFVATGNTNRYTVQDIFFVGKQLFRFDGAWLASMIAANNPNLNYGVTLIPGTKSNPGIRGVSRYENSSLSIPIGAKEKDGAYDFMNWFTHEGVKDFLLEIGSLPANNTLFDDPDLRASSKAFPSFMDALKTGNGVSAPKMAESAQYISLINEYLDYVYNGSKKPEQAMDELQAQALKLK